MKSHGIFYGTFNEIVFQSSFEREDVNKAENTFYGQKKDRLAKLYRRRRVRKYYKSIRCLDIVNRKKFQKALTVLTFAEKSLYCNDYEIYCKSLTLPVSLVTFVSSNKHHNCKAKVHCLSSKTQFIEKKCLLLVLPKMPSFFSDQNAEFLTDRPIKT